MQYYSNSTKVSDKCVNFQILCPWLNGKIFRSKKTPKALHNLPFTKKNACKMEIFSQLYINVEKHSSFLLIVWDNKNDNCVHDLGKYSFHI